MKTQYCRHDGGTTNPQPGPTPLLRVGQVVMRSILANKGVAVGVVKNMHDHAASVEWLAQPVNLPALSRTVDIYLIPLPPCANASFARFLKKHEHLRSDLVWLNALKIALLTVAIFPYTHGQDATTDDLIGEVHTQYGLLNHLQGRLKLTQDELDLTRQELANAKKAMAIPSWAIAPTSTSTEGN